MVTNSQNVKAFVPYKAKDSKASVPTILDLVEQLKKAPVNVSLWDILTIP